MATTVQLPKDWEGFEAELTSSGGDVRLVLWAVYTPVDYVACVLDANTQQWVERKFAADIEDAKAEAEAAANAHARHLLKRAGSKQKVPPIAWKPR